MPKQAHEMNVEQYRRLVENRRRRSVRALGDGSARPGARSPLAKVLATAARTLRLREQAEQVWEMILARELSGLVRVAGVVGDELLVAVAGSAAGYELRRRQGRLERRLGELVPGLRRLRVVGADGDQAGCTGGTGGGDRR